MDVKSLTFIFCCEVIAIIIKCACATVCVAQVFFVDRNKWPLPYLPPWSGRGLGGGYPINFVANAPTLVV